MDKGRTKRSILTLPIFFFDLPHLTDYYPRCIIVSIATFGML